VLKKIQVEIDLKLVQSFDHQEDPFGCRVRSQTRGASTTVNSGSPFSAFSDFCLLCVCCVFADLLMGGKNVRNYRLA
jgi:hypothetical protein